MKVVVIGAGFGGLAAAYTLQASGCRVTLLERGEAVGGKARTVRVGDHGVPAGPTVMTLRHIFDRLFAEAGDRLEDHVRVHPLERFAHHRWSASEQLDLFRDVETSADAIAEFAGAREADGYRRFVADAADVFASVERPFIHAARADLVALTRANGPFGARRMKPFSTFWSVVGRHFRDPRLHQLFGRYATYCGASPFAAPGTLMLVAHAEQRGVWAVSGGMSALARAIADRFEAHGGEIRTGEAAEEIVLGRGRDRVEGVATSKGTVPADAIVVNADVSSLGAGLLGKRVRRAARDVPPAARSLSAVALCLSARADTALPHHSVFFSGDYRAEFDALIGKRAMPQEPSIYVCAPHEAGAGELQPVLIVMNAPPTGDQTPFDSEAIQQCETQALSRLRHCGISLDIRQRSVTTPADLAQMFPATGGAIYGRASHGWTASFRRPGIRSKIKGLYLAGGSAHPGPGVPMSTLSGHSAATCLLADFALQSQFRPTVISGGISTASARMVNTPLR